MQECRLIDSELNATGLHILNGSGQVKCDCPGFGAGHQAAWAKLLTESTNLTHHIGCCYGDVEIEPAAFNLLDQVIKTNKVRSSRLRLVGFLALGENQYPHLFAGTGGQHRYSAHHLVSVARIDAELHMNFNSRIEIYVAKLVEESNSAVR